MKLCHSQLPSFEGRTLNVMNVSPLKRVNLRGYSLMYANCKAPHACLAKKYECQTCNCAMFWLGNKVIV